MVEARAQSPDDTSDQWPLVARFFGQLEASAEEY
jgi:hypothetical protein